MGNSNAPKMEVKCGVDNCQYNKSYLCHADSIEVNTLGDGKAQTSDGTSCITFKNGK